MGASRDSFFKFPRTPHLCGSTGTDDDRQLSRPASARLIADSSLVVEEKLDGTNVGVHFTAGGRMVLQCRGHELTEGMHPQYDLFKQWTLVQRPRLEARLETRFILYGEWLYAQHTLHYRALPHYFFALDVYDQDTGRFLDHDARLRRLAGTGLPTVPVLHRGPATLPTLRALLRPSAFASTFEHPETGRAEAWMEGLYLRTEAGGVVTARAKLVRPEFVAKLQRDERWRHRPMILNELAPGADLWA